MKLRDLFEKLSKDERDKFAAKVGINAGYLWQLATQWKGKKPSLELLKKIADADERLTVAGLVEEFTSHDEPAGDTAAKAPPVVVTPSYAGPDRRSDRKAGVQ